MIYERCTGCTMKRTKQNPSIISRKTWVYISAKGLTTVGFLLQTKSQNLFLCVAAKLLQLASEG